MMRRSSRLQLRKLRSVIRLASVPEHDEENEDEVTEANPQELAPVVQPPPPAPDPLSIPSIGVQLQDVPPPPYWFGWFWRKQTWVHFPPPPPPPFLLGGDPPSCALFNNEEDDAGPSLSEMAANMQEGDDGNVLQSAVQVFLEQEYHRFLHGLEAIFTQQQDYVDDIQLGAGALPELESDPAHFLMPLRPPPSYDVAIALKQQQMEAMESAATNGIPLNCGNSGIDKVLAGQGIQNGITFGANDLERVALPPPPPGQWAFEYDQAAHGASGYQYDNMLPLPSYESTFVHLMPAATVTGQPEDVAATPQTERFDKALSTDHAKQQFGGL